MDLHRVQTKDVSASIPNARAVLVGLSFGKIDATPRQGRHPITF